MKLLVQVGLVFALIEALSGAPPNVDTAGPNKTPVRPVPLPGVIPHKETKPTPGVVHSETNVKPVNPPPPGVQSDAPHPVPQPAPIPKQTRPARQSETDIPSRPPPGAQNAEPVPQPAPIPKQTRPSRETHSETDVKPANLPPPGVQSDAPHAVPLPAPIPKQTRPTRQVQSDAPHPVPLPAPIPKQIRPARESEPVKPVPLPASITPQKETKPVIPPKSQLTKPTPGVVSGSAHH